MPYAVEIADVAFDELKAIKPFYRSKIIDAIDEQLVLQPTTETRNRKCLIGVQPQFEHEEPVWELRVADFRVYYDVSEESETVTVRAIRQKPLHSTTEQIL